MSKSLPTSGQLERNLSQGILRIYRQELKHTPSKVTCQLFENKLAIIVENALTAVEQTLAAAGNNDNIVKRLSTTINDVIEIKIKDLIESILTVKVKDILFDSTVKTNCAGAIATLEHTPLVRNPESIPKNKKAVKKKSAHPVENASSETSSKDSKIQ